mgnify:CR=1 FL=1
MTRSLPHRGPQGWRKWCCAATKRFCMRSSATVPLSRCSGPTLLSWRQCASFIFHMCTARYSQASTTGSMMMIAVRGRSGTGRAGPATGLDPAKQRWRHRCAARLREGHECDGPRLDATVRSRFGSTCSVEERAEPLGLGGQEHSSGYRLCSAHLSRVLPARERGEKVLPNSRDTANERFVTLASHLGMEQATRSSRQGMELVLAS